MLLSVLPSLCVPKSCRCFKRSTFHVWKVGSVSALVSMKVVKLIKNRRMKSVNLAFRIFAHGKQACFGLSRLSFAAAKTEKNHKGSDRSQRAEGCRRKSEGATQFNREVPFERFPPLVFQHFSTRFDCTDAFPQHNDIAPQNTE